MWCFRSVFCRHLYIWVATNTAIYSHEQTACSRYYFVRWRVAVWACFNVLVSITVFQRDLDRVWLSVPTARRWLLSAAYTDAKVWEAREKDPQSLGKSFTALSSAFILNATNSSVSSVCKKGILVFLERRFYTENRNKLNTSLSLKICVFICLDIWKYVSTSLWCDAYAGGPKWRCSRLFFSFFKVHSERVW